MLQLICRQVRVRDGHVGASSETLTVLVDFTQQKRLDLLGELLGLLLMIGADKNEMGRGIVKPTENGVAAREHEADVGRLCSSVT